MNIILGVGDSKLANRAIIEIISEYTVETGWSEIDTNMQF